MKRGNVRIDLQWNSSSEGGHGKELGRWQGGSKG